MSQPELLKRIVNALDRIGVEYMLTGSMASSLQGQPRASHDIDLVINLSAGSVDQFVQALQAPDLFLDREAIAEAVRRKRMFNVLALTEGDKIDFWLLTDSPFDRSRFARKYVESYAGIPLQISRPEDTILAKLNWAKLSGGSTKQMGDALRVYQINRDGLDQQYLSDWAEQLGVRPLLDDVRQQVGA